MKKIILCMVTSMMVFAFVNAQTDKVGINTLTPDETLHVIGDIILLESPDGTKKVMLRTGGADGELKSLGDLYVRAQGNDVLINHVGTDGKVGIGTPAPLEELDVNGAIRLGTTSTSNSGSIRFNDVTDDFEGFDGAEWKSLTDGGGAGHWIQNGTKIYYLGSVGINTSSPNADLHVVGDTLLLESPDGTKKLLLRNAGADSEIKSLGDLYIRGQGNDVLINHVAADGNVGIGKTTPNAKLHVDGNFKIGNDQIDFIEQNYFNTATDAYGRVFLKDETDNNRILMNASSVYDFFVENDANEASIILQDYQANERLRLFSDNTAGGFYIKNNDPSDNQDKTMIYARAGTFGTPILGLSNIDFSPTIELRGDNFSGGRINLFGESGTFGSELVKIVAKENDQRGARIDMKSDDGTAMIIMKTAESSDIQQGIIELHNGLGTRTIKLDGQAGLNDHAHISLYKGNGTKSIEINSNWNNEGDSRIVTDELQIVGGSDFAEHFDIIEETVAPIPGMVVSIDPNSTGKLTLSTQAYDRKVAGIISGANGVETGFFMGQSGSIADGDFPIALTGRVYVYANDEGGKISPGDLLTTSSTKGFAMKVQNYQLAQGAIIGKAMTEVDENGFVLILVNLQ